ncbi:glycoside hydrolase family 3 N-terminal domain-containing protein [Bythopirellula polymerisocia]|uniref:beta-glucosidase n=1 Tax=Bythopirellula polymerisocia TaxID=2528003 RepID=A0A5C6CWW9_9BACT|nr:glycoside hydrolase family 3 N-terminal domain-containing protein [Bythopirellula polymerisocia]TWU28365.1 Periplasmic beta-glucosidase precursor [Bythopirellula polymerisocia]
MSIDAITVSTPIYQLADKPIEQRVADLLSRMTLEEKVAQMVCVWNEKNDKLLDEQACFDPVRAKSRFGHGHGLGQVGRLSDAGSNMGKSFASGRNALQMAELANTIQRWFIENSRLGIPVIFHEECLHGLMAVDATSFPQPIGLAATFDPDLVREVFQVTASETRCRGGHHALAPVVDVARDARWGRVEETFGEDPYLVATMGIAAVLGLQGDRSFQDGRSVIATLKHFAAHGQPESGNNCAPVNVSMRVLREVFLYPFKQAIKHGKALAVMASYNEIDGVPSHANRWLLRDVLRDEWGFEGIVVSDYYAVRELNERPELYGHHLAADGKQAGELAVRAGVNIELPEPDCYKSLIESVDAGLVTEGNIDELVSPLLKQKFQLGLFDNPYVDPEVAQQISGSEEHRTIALRAAHKTITLLKNRNQTVPLDLDKISTIAVIGPNADRILLGGYSGLPRFQSTVLKGIQDHVGTSAQVVYHEGCKITKGGSWFEDTVVPSDVEEDRRSIAEAVEIARKADVIVLAVGGNEQTSREAWMGNHLGDRTSLQLFGMQDALVDALVELGKPIVAFLFNGRPLAIGNLSEKADALFECWYLGQESGRAVADVLFGDANPGGKLPISIPRSVGHVPCFYNYKPSARRGYLFDDATPLYPFGFGLSYTQFEIGQPRLAHSRIAVGESTFVQVDVKNIGKRLGDVVVQMYIRDSVSSVTRPIKELKRFQRVTLEPGENRTINLEITPDSLAFYDIEMNHVVEPGEFKVMVGDSSRDSDLQTTVLKVVE